MNMPFCDQCAVANRCMQDLALFEQTVKDLKAEQVSAPVKRAEPERAEPTVRVRADGNRKLSYKETRELAELPGRISALEQEQKEIGMQLEDPALYQADPLKANALSERLAVIDDELLVLLERWEELEK